MVRFSLVGLLLLWLGLAGCAAIEPVSTVAPFSPNNPDPDAAKLAAMGALAATLAKKETAQGVVLRQVDTDLFVTIFRFVDQPMAKEIVVIVPDPGAAIDHWVSTTDTTSPLLAQPGPDLNLPALRVGPNRVNLAITSYWSGCTLKGLTLIYSQASQLMWTAQCATPQGIVTGFMDNPTATFLPSGAPPAPLTPIATTKP